MEHRAWVEALRREGDAIVGVAPTDIDVPTCPGWTLIGLFHHLGSVHRWQVAQIATPDPGALQPPPKVDLPQEPEEITDWLIDGVDELADLLDDVGPDRPCSSWFGPRPASFWARRAAHETAAHRWDAQATVTSPEPFAPELAVDMIDELFEVVVPRRLERTPWPGGASTLHLHATDVEGAPDGAGEWMLHVDGTAVTVERTHGKGDVAVRGPASDLALLVLGRIPISRLEVFGDPSLVELWQSTVRI